MRVRYKAFVVAACTALGLAPGAAFADDIGNNLDPSVDAVAEVMPLTLGGANGGTSLYVIPRNGDGKNGCNLTGTTELKVSVASSDTAVATVSPTTVTFTSCGEVRPLTVVPHGQGTAMVYLTMVANNSDGTFNLAPAQFTVTVSPPPNTAPAVVVAGVTAGAQYAVGSVPAATCQVSDLEDGSTSFPATLGAVSGPYAADGLGSQTVSCSYTDAGGLTAVASETYVIVDPTAPVVTAQTTPGTPDGHNGWYVSDVSLDWAVAEPESPNSLVTTGCDDLSVTGDQLAQAYTCSATSAGGVAASSVTIMRDATAPSGVQFVGGPVNGGLYFPTTVPQPGTCTATDATSGMDGCEVSGYSAAVGSHQVTATATDVAGNSATATANYEVYTLQLSGFFQPVDVGGVLNTVKNGSTVPLKFRVFDRGVEQKSTSIIKQFQQQKTGCTTGAVEDAIEEIANTGGTSLRYDSTAGQFIQNWKTPSGASSCYTVVVTTIDGSTLSAKFKLK